MPLACGPTESRGHDRRPGKAVLFDLAVKPPCGPTDDSTAGLVTISPVGGSPVDHGEMAEWTKATVSKTVESYLGFRGFESHSLRGEKPSYSLGSLAPIRGRFRLPAGSGERWAEALCRGLSIAEKVRIPLSPLLTTLPSWEGD